MILFILGLLIITVVTFFTYRKKIKENLETIETTYQDEQEKRYNILGKGNPDQTLVPQGKPGAVDYIKIFNDLTKPENYMKTGDAKFAEDKIQQTIPSGEVDEKMVSCRSITKCSQLNNGDCGYCLYSNEFKYGGTGGPGADVCPSNAWTNNPDKCQELREKEICKQVKNCGGLVGEAADICAWCPTSGRAMPYKQAGNKKVPKYPDDVCNNQGYGILDAKDCAKFASDHPCLTPTAYSGPLSPTCLSGLWKKAIGEDRRTIDWISYAKNKGAYWNTIGMNKVLSDMKAWKAYTKSSDYKTAVKGSLMCYGNKPDPCATQFQPKPNECLDELWKKGGGEEAGTGLPSKAGSYKAGQSPYKNTIGGYQYTLDQAKEACSKEGARLCKQSEIMDKNICNAGWTENGVRGYPMADGGGSGCGGSRKGWRTWSTNPNSKGSAHCCYEFNRDDSKNSIIDTTKSLAQKALTGDKTEQAGYMKMVYGKHWTPPPPPKVGDTVQLKWKEGSINAVHTGIVTQKLGNKCSIMWTNYKGSKSLNRYSLKNDASGMKSQRYWFGWPGIPAEALKSPNVDAGGLVLENHLNVTNACSKAPSACALNCRRILEGVLERFPIPQDCVVNNWSSWSSCNKTCGGGIQSRSRNVKYQAKFGGKACPSLDEKRMCNTSPCYPANYKGCYKDCQGRDLPNFVGNLTKNQCGQKARELNNKYYGLQYQNGVGKGDKDLAECWLGDSYGKQGGANNCKNIGRSNNSLAYGQSCSNAIYENENWKASVPIKWSNVAGGLKNVSASGNGYIWGVNKNDAIYKRSKNSGSWQRVNGSLKQISGGQNEVWGVNRNDAIYKRPVNGGGNWQNISGSLKNVSASGNGYIWGVNKNDNIYKCAKPCNGKWERINGGLKQISGGQKEVWGVNRNNAIYKRPVNGGGNWTRIGGSLKNVSAGNPKYIFGINYNDNIYKCAKPCNGKWERISGGLKQIDGGNSIVWGVNKSDMIYKSPT